MKQIKNLTKILTKKKTMKNDSPWKKTPTFTYSSDEKVFFFPITKLLLRVFSHYYHVPLHFKL